MTTPAELIRVFDERVKAYADAKGEYRRLRTELRFANAADDATWRAKYEAFQQARIARHKAARLRLAALDRVLANSEAQDIIARRMTGATRGE